MIATPAPTPSPTPDACGGYGRLLASLNRPAIGYSTCVTPVGTTMLEEGYQVTIQGDAIAVSYPRGFQRFGVANRLELDLIGPNQNRITGPGGAQNGLSDFGAVSNTR